MIGLVVAAIANLVVTVIPGDSDNTGEQDFVQNLCCTCFIFRVFPTVIEDRPFSTNSSVLKIFVPPGIQFSNNSHRNF